MITKARNNNKLHCDNKKEGNPPKIDIYRQVQVDQYLEEALMLVKLLGVTVFSEGKKKASKKPKAKNIKTVNPKPIEIVTSDDSINAEVLLKGGKASSIYLNKYLLNCGYIQPSYKFTIAKINKDGSGRFWANPKIEFLDYDWFLVLNDTNNHKLHYFKIPAKSIAKDTVKTRTVSNKSGDVIQIDLEIVNGENGFICERSGINYQQWYLETIEY